MTDAAWAFYGLVVTNGCGLVALWIRSGRTKRTAESAQASAAVAAHEVRPNSGHSLADAVNRTEAAVERNTRDIAVLTGQFKEHVLTEQQHRRRRR